MKLTSEVFIEIDSNFEAPIGSQFEAEILTVQEENCNVEFWFGKDGPPDIVGGGNNNKSSRKENKPSFDIFIVPNPSNGSFEVLLSKQLEVFDYQLYNFMGEVVSNGTENSKSNFKINASNLASGVYLLKVSYGNESISKQVIIN